MRLLRKDLARQVFGRFAMPGLPRARGECQRSHGPNGAIDRVDGMAERNRCQAHHHADEPAVEAPNLLPALVDRHQGPAGHIRAGQAEDSQNAAQEFKAGKSAAGIIKFEWKDLFTPQGRPDPRVIPRLEGLGIQSEDRIVLISNKGVRSAAAAYALLALGYAHAQNFADGWNSLKP